MSGSGYNDPKKLADAKALAMMFGKSSQKGGGGGGGGGSRRYGDDFESRAPREKYNYSPPPPPRTIISNIPPPSRRNYTDTLASGTLSRPPGHILGSSPMDFLNRREPTPQPTSANPPQSTSHRSAMAAIPPSMTSNPARNVVQRQNGTGVSGNASLSIAPARADEGHMADTKAEPLAASGTANGQSNAESPISTAPPQAPTLAPRSLQNSIASTWAASYNDASDEEEEEGEITEVPMAEPPRNQSVPNLPRVDEDLIMVSPDHKPSTPDIEGMPKPLLVPTGTTNGSPVQEVQNSIALPSQRNGHGPDQGSSAIERASHELATSRYQTRGEIKPGEPTSISNLRPQAPGFIPVSRDVSLDSPTSPPGFPSSAPTANPSATTLHAESREGAPSHQSYANYPVAENHDCSSSFDGHLITITPVRITDGFLVPGPTNGHVLMQPHLDTPHRPQTSLMQSSAMSMTPGPSQPSQPSQTGENKTTAPVQKPKAPRKTQGLKSSMWAS